MPIGWIPLGLDVDYEARPVGTLGLIGAFLVVFLATLQLDFETLRPFLLDPDALEPWQFVTSAFLHDGWGHLLFNALYVWIFGRYIEERLGPLRLVLLFLAFSAVADAAYLWRGQGLPSLGASGGIAGLMGLVLFTAPRATVKVHWSLGITRFHRWRSPPAWLFLGLWILVDLVGAYRAAKGQAVGVAHAAHLGGVLAGCLTAWLLRSRLAQGTPWHLPRDRFAGLRVTDGYRELVASEGIWETIHEHKRREARDEPEVYDITPDED